ncbi:MAG TPA: ATP-binding protein [Gemmatimonadaceae bacterium]|nr:ATP-binding protein [Gemmatimonadaceae bacterium]
MSTRRPVESSDDGDHAARPAAAPSDAVHEREEPDGPGGSGDSDDPTGMGLADIRARQQAAVAKFGVRALGGLAVPELLREAAEVVSATLDTEFVKLLELLPDEQTARLVAGVGWREGVVGSATIRVGRDSQAGYALLSHAPVIVEDLRTETRLDDPPLLREHGVVSGMSVILYGPGGRSYGVIGAHTARRRRFTQDDVNFLQGIANVLSAAFHRQHVEDELRRAHAEAEAYAGLLQEQALELEQQIEEAQALAEELAQTNEQLLRTTAEAEAAREAADAANQAKSQFLATMSHELRTPLNAITGYVQLLELGLHGPVTEGQRRALERIDRAQRHLLGLINDVLNYARLESGRVEYALEPVRVADVIRDIWPMVEPQIAAAGLTFDVRLPEDDGRPSVTVWADREKLAQILLNLLSNAVKFTPAERDGGPGRVTLELSADDGVEAGTGADAGAARSGELVSLRLSDTGVGIPAGKLESIFEPFVQVQSELTRQSGGTGLGLAISRDLARGMGGDLRVESTEGVGSTFTLVLRRVVEATGEPAERRSGGERRVDEDRRGGDDRREREGEATER